MCSITASKLRYFEVRGRNNEAVTAEIDAFTRFNSIVALFRRLHSTPSGEQAEGSQDCFAPSNGEQKLSHNTPKKGAAIEILVKITVSKSQRMSLNVAN